MWKIENIVLQGEYNYALVPDHPNATKDGYVLEHRIIIENHINRILDSNEVVHHINGNKRDNRIENLKVVSNSDHAKLHVSQRGRKMVELKCPWCGVIFIRRKNNSFMIGKSKYTCCSSHCRGCFSRKIQLYGKTAEVELAISGNLVREFIFHDNPEQTDEQQDA